MLVHTQCTLAVRSRSHKVHCTAQACRSMSQRSHALELGAAAAVACCAAAWYMHTQRPALYSKAQRWVSRNAPAWKAKAIGAEGLLEPGEKPWSADGSKGPPQCRPIDTVTELLTWTPPATPAAADAKAVVLPAGSSNSSTDPCVCTTPLYIPSGQPVGFPSPSAAAAAAVQSRPQLLVCHDMRGGYLDYEARLDGSVDANQYRIWHWDCIDVFVYFSHHLVTIPPKGWTHATHKHGVKMLGTFITEFGQGRLRCDRLFSSAESARQVADQLVAIAQHYGFEGWLVNIENPLNADQVSIMQHFVGYLRARTRDTCPDGMVVWYDAVTTAGQLKWQNGLTPLNAPFFDLADALFVNYTWTPPQLPTTTAAAGGRAHSVYMGVDVFGRDSYGGGGFGVNLALEAAREVGLSAALFAPGWVHENLDNSRFHQLQDQWWAQVAHSWGCSHPVVTHLPFSTSFNTGAGWAYFAAGQLQSNNGLATAAAVAAAAAATAVAVAGDGGGSDSTAVAAAVSEDNTSTSSSQAAVGATGAGSWYNLCETDTLPCVRNPLTQQVVTGPVSGYLSGCTAYEGGSCLVLYQQQQQQQSALTGAAAGLPGSSNTQGTVDSSNSSSSSSGSKDAVPCCPVVTVPQATALSSSSSSSSSQRFALLQLFTAHVPLADSATVNLSCVYAVKPQAAAAAAGSEQTSSSDASKLKGKPETRQLALWVMTKEAGNTGRTLCLPTVGDTTFSSSSSNNKAVSTGPIVAASGEASDVELVLVPSAGSGMAAVAAVGSVQLLPMAQPQGATTAAADSMEGADESSNSSSSSSAPSWVTPLPAEVGGWQWQQQGWQVQLPAGSVITGAGVAVPVVDGVPAAAAAGGGGVAAHAEQASDTDFDVLALIGQMQVSVV